MLDDFGFLARLLGRALGSRAIDRRGEEGWAQPPLLIVRCIAPCSCSGFLTSTVGICKHYTTYAPSAVFAFLKPQDNVSHPQCYFRWTDSRRVTLRSSLLVSFLQM